MVYPQIKITGDASVAVVFGDEISVEINQQIRAFDEALTEEEIDGIYETVPTYCTLMIHYAPEIIRYHELCARLEALLSVDHKAQKMNTIVMEVPMSAVNTARTFKVSANPCIFPTRSSWWKADTPTIASAPGRNWKSAVRQRKPAVKFSSMTSIV